MTSRRNRTRLDRIERADIALRAYSYAADSSDDAEAITDLVADIGHYCLEHDLAYLHLLSLGISHWRLEMTDPDGMVMPEVGIIINDNESNEQ